MISRGIPDLLFMNVQQRLGELSYRYPAFQNDNEIARTMNKQMSQHSTCAT